MQNTLAIGGAYARIQISHTLGEFLNYYLATGDTNSHPVNFEIFPE